LVTNWTHSMKERETQKQLNTIKGKERPVKETSLGFVHSIGFRQRQRSRLEERGVDDTAFGTARERTRTQRAGQKLIEQKSGNRAGGGERTGQISKIGPPKVSYDRNVRRGEKTSGVRRQKRAVGSVGGGGGRSQRG